GLGSNVTSVEFIPVSALDRWPNRFSGVHPGEAVTYSRTRFTRECSPFCGIREFTVHFFISMASYRAVKRTEPSPETLRESTQLRDRKPEEPPQRPSEDPRRDSGDYRPQYLDLPPRRG